MARGKKSYATKKQSTAKKRGSSTKRAAQMSWAMAGNKDGGGKRKKAKPMKKR
jgi:hypothetical protein